jgi:crotonobetainyl-CoA:carnitine CoA-transferase CaiB-like acyl-CoA transferase
VNGPLNGVRVVEMASVWGAWAGKLLGDLGADVVVVEPPGGHLTRRFGPFADDEPNPNQSLWWWFYNTSKRSVVLDLDTGSDQDEFRRLVRGADIVLEGEPPHRLAELGIDETDFRAAQPDLIWTSVTSHGRASDRSLQPWTDLTIAAASGMAWLNGYDDHSLPPMRGRGNQTIQVAGTHAAMATLTALLHRDVTGLGQHVDVSAFAACNVTTESGTFVWLVAKDTVQRQTGRHAATQPTMGVQVQAADGHHVTTGFLPHRAEDFQVILDWLDDLELRETSPEVFWLDIGVARGGVDVRREWGDAEPVSILGAARAALVHIAEHVTSLEFFEGAQRRNLQVGAILSPEEAYENEHFIDRGFQATVDHDELGREIRYPGAPFVLSASPWGISRRPPLIGEHNDEVLGAS